MSALDTDRIITDTAKLIAEHYVFPEIAEQLSALLAERLAAGRYAAAGTAQELGALVTEDLQSVNGDRHLRLQFHADEIPAEPGGAVLAELTREADGSMNGVPLIQRLDGGVALLELAPIIFPMQLKDGATGETLRAALNLVASAEALIIDLRRNRGGSPESVAFVCGYLLDESTHLNTNYLRDGDTYVQSWSLPYVPGARFGGRKPLYILTSGTSFSGAEELAYDLQQLGRAVVVGERSRGGAHPREGYTVHPHLEATIPTGRSINPVSGTDWEGVGVQPDIEVPAAEALERAYREALAALAEGREAAQAAPVTA
ncbi:S41 family peptidase [Streptacidiphilus carbonis]|uniref:S41 family peptidase n=1 Tax=Streptacidiphilus carbonis TaxID=105422 RepID=UPI0005A9D61E|nr:S41 family peptidase [Streptacidiphilus carbonis]